ncbi:cell division protein FtsZ homolog 2-2, chloroplastic-like protein [Tanacetum coccineum]|uniref:Cell division protein FtsZ homolog 2-2, chloroplastic-like protein n=1 Tax=Tanacetum coccineum TaxID=301880 RepID=A0ABQ4WQW6_9ASTR
MATCVTPSLIPLEMRYSIRDSGFSRGKKSNLRMITFSTKVRCMAANSHKDQFLNLHPEVTMLKGEGNGNGNVTEILRDEGLGGGYNEAKIKVIGVGGGGSNAVNRMIESEMKGVEFWIVNTDVQALKMSPVFQEQRLQIGQELTRGLGAGGNPDVGDNCDLKAGMGGGTGTGAAPIIAGVAKSMGILTVGIVTTPNFTIEAVERAFSSTRLIASLRENVDTLIVIPNDKLLTAVSPSTPVTEAFNLADDILRQGVRGISDIITRRKTRARDAALNAIQSPLLDIGIERATGIVWNITGGSDLTLFEVNAAAEVIYDLVDPSANLIFGSVIDPSISGQGGQADLGGMNRRSPAFTEGGSVEIPEFLRKKGRSRYPRA